MGDAFERAKERAAEEAEAIRAKLAEGRLSGDGPDDVAVPRLDFGTLYGGGQHGDRI